MTHRAFYSLAEHKTTDLIGWARSHRREYLMVVFQRKWRAREGGDTRTLRANMWESGCEVVFDFRWDGVTERESGGEDTTRVPGTA
jgi:hypothetical protein